MKGKQFHTDFMNVSCTCYYNAIRNLNKNKCSIFTRSTNRAIYKIIVEIYSQNFVVFLHFFMRRD